MGSLWGPYSEYIFTLCAFSWSSATFLFSRLPCDQSSSLIHPHSMTNQSMPLLWISVGIYLYLLPCKVGNQIHCQRFYPLRGFPSFLPNEAVNQKQSTSNCQPIMQTHLFTRSKFFFFFFFLQNTGLIQANQGRKESSPRSMFGMPMDMSDTSDY